MADDITLNSMAGGSVVATDDIVNKHYQRIKLIHGADGVNDGDVSSANPLPVNLTSATKTIITTTTPLGIAGSYTSAAFDHGVGGTFVTHYIFANVDGTHYHEVSHDGTNWQIANTAVVTGGTPLFERHEVTGRYSRMRYVNGGVAQTTFYHQGIQKFFGNDEYIRISELQNAVTGDKQHNVTAPSTEAHEVIGAVAKAAAPTYVEGNVVMPRVTLSGDQAVTLDGEAVVLGAGTAGIGKLTANSGVDIGDVDVLSMPAVTQPTASNLNAQVVGELAHDAIDSGNPHKIGGKARNANAALVANNDRVDATFDLGGRLINKIGNPRGLFISNTITLTTTTETTLLAAAASTFHDLTQLEITNSSATAVVVSIRDATAGTVRRNYAIAANGGAIIPMLYPLEQTALNNNWTAQLSGAVSSVYINAIGIKNI